VLAEKEGRGILAEHFIFGFFREDDILAAF